MPFTCGQHRAFVYNRGGQTLVGELTPLTSVRWERVRDEISVAEVEVPTHECCELLGDLRTILHELHIEREGVVVWQGPITRLEYEFNQVQVFAEDVLWQAKRKVLEVGYTQAHPNIYNVVTRMDWLLRDNCYALNSDPWQVVPHLHPIHHAGDPKTSRNVNPWQFYVWEDFDKYAEDSGADYTVVNRDIYYFDSHLAWLILPDMPEQYLSQHPRIVEYGNELATRGFVTNGEGQAGSAQVSAELVNLYGIVDYLVTNRQEGSAEQATPEEIAGWAETAGRNISSKAPSPVGIIIPANTTLLPGGPWEIDDLVPGAWFKVQIDRLCRQAVDLWQRIHQVTVTESAPEGELVQFTSIAPPAQMVMP